MKHSNLIKAFFIIIAFSSTTATGAYLKDRVDSAYQNSFSFMAVDELSYQTGDNVLVTRNNQRVIAIARVSFSRSGYVYCDIVKNIIGRMPTKGDVVTQAGSEVITAATRYGDDSALVEQWEAALFPSIDIPFDKNIAFSGVHDPFIKSGNSVVLQGIQSAQIQGELEIMLAEDGRSISLASKGATMSQVLRGISARTGAAIYVDPSAQHIVSSTMVTHSFTNKSLDSGLADILRLYGLSYFHDSGRYHIVPSSAAATSVSGYGDNSVIEVAYLKFISPSVVVDTINALGLPILIIKAQEEKSTDILFEQKSTTEIAELPKSKTLKAFGVPLLTTVSSQETTIADDDKHEFKNEIGETSKLNFVILKGQPETIKIAKTLISQIDMPLKTIELRLFVVDVAREYSNKLSLSLLPSLAADNYATILNEQKLSVLDGRKGSISLIGNSRPSGSKVIVESISLTVEAKLTGENDIVLKLRPIVEKHRTEKSFLPISLPLPFLSNKSFKEVKSMDTVITLKDEQEYLLGLSKIQTEAYDQDHGVQRIFKTKKTNVEGREIALIIVPHIVKNNDVMQYEYKSKEPVMRRSNYIDESDGNVVEDSEK